MTKPLEPDYKALRGAIRALNPLDHELRRVVVEWLHAWSINQRAREVHVQGREAGASPASSAAAREEGGAR